ncbi:hypothetical protein NXW09_28840 [Bacteroides ovatus]|nr:hypothetical protein [Bacteroides ovatus]
MVDVKTCHDNAQKRRKWIWPLCIWKKRWHISAPEKRVPDAVGRYPRKDSYRAYGFYQQ